MIERENPSSTLKSFTVQYVFLFCKSIRPELLSWFRYTFGIQKSNILFFWLIIINKNIINITPRLLVIVIPWVVRLYVEIIHEL